MANIEGDSVAGLNLRNRYGWISNAEALAERVFLSGLKGAYQKHGRSAPVKRDVISPADAAC